MLCMSQRILYLGNKLANKGFTPTGIDTLGPRLEAEGFQLRYASSRRNKVLRLLAMFWAVLKSRNWAAYVLIDTYSTQSFWFAYCTGRLCSLLGLAYIPILHGGNLPERLKTSPKASKFLFRNAYINVAPSAYLMDCFSKNGYKKLINIPNAIDLSLYHFKQRKSIQPKLLWVRSFAEIYNPLLAIHLFHSLHLKYPAAELCMVGPDKDGSLELCKAEAERLGITVRFTGKLSREAWSTLATDYDLFINTTHYDNTPVSLLEAMALGLPVISTNVGGISKLITDDQNGLLVAANDEAAFVSAIERLLQHPELVDHLTTRAYQTVQTFNWEEVKKQWHKLLF